MMPEKETNEFLNLFPTPIQITELKLNIDSLLEFCYEMKHKDENGVEKTNIGGWQSDNVVDETHTEFVKLKTEIEDAAKIYHEKLQFKKTLKQKIENIWININQKGHSNEYHVHPGAVLSGAFYLATGKTSIIFRHPFSEINNYYWNSSIIDKEDLATSNEGTIKPIPNILLIFPPWIWHKVPMNKENTDRVSISFNTILYQKEIEEMNEDDARLWKECYQMIKKEEKEYEKGTNSQS